MRTRLCRCGRCLASCLHSNTYRTPIRRYLPVRSALSFEFKGQRKTEEVCTANRTMSGLPRMVIKWLQSLDLTHPIKNVRRDFSNGYLVAEVFAWYYPHDIQMHSFVNGSSIQARQGNWQQLERFFAKEKLPISQDYIEGTIHCKPGAAKALLEQIYTLLTKKELRYIPAINQPDDFTDSTYQSQLPPFARATAIQSIKTNLANTELQMDPDRTVCAQKAKEIVESHTNHRKKEREDFPDRFKIRRRGQPNTSSTGSYAQQHKVCPVEVTVMQHQAE